MAEHQSPKVSAIITTYNRAGLLPRAVNSILAQTFTDYEIIIVDDCSMDNTQEVIAGFSDPRIRSFKHEQNKGQAAARNTGISHAIGEFVAFLDDDDEWLEFKLEKQVDSLDSSPPSVGVIYGWMNWIDDSSGQVTRPRHSTMSGDVFDAALSMDAPCSADSMLARTSAVREVGGFDERLRTHEDRMFACRMAQRYEFAVLPEIIAIAHTGHGKTQTTKPTRERFRVAADSTRTFIDAFTEEFQGRPEVHSRVLRRLAISEMRGARFGAALSSCGRAIALDTLSLSNLSTAALLAKIFLWYATPLSHLRPRVKSMLGRWNPSKG